MTVTNVPTQVEYVMHLGDNALILAQQLARWCGHGPALELDIALTNISLDLLGQARMYLAYAAELEGQGRSEDDLAYFRDTHQFRNVLLVEQPNGDWGRTILRQFFFDAYHYHLCASLKQSSDPRLVEIAEKAFKEITYHLRFSSEWVVRLGDGTPESHQRMQTAVDDLWSFTGEMLTPANLDQSATQQGWAGDLNLIQPLWMAEVQRTFTQAQLTIPANSWMQKGGKTGIHSEHLGYILAEMQHLQRTYPGNIW
jgi:ring-1,2-phenylacetyl-CoA epoxidase subunit PaaC